MSSPNPSETQPKFRCIAPQCATLVPKPVHQNVRRAQQIRARPSVVCAPISRALSHSSLPFGELLHVRSTHSRSRVRVAPSFASRAAACVAQPVGVRVGVSRSRTGSGSRTGPGGFGFAHRSGRLSCSLSRSRTDPGGAPVRAASRSRGPSRRVRGRAPVQAASGSRTGPGGFGIRAPVRAASAFAHRSGRLRVRASVQTASRSRTGPDGFAFARPVASGSGSRAVQTASGSRGPSRRVRAADRGAFAFAPPRASGSCARSRSGRVEFAVRTADRGAFAFRVAGRVRFSRRFSRWRCPSRLPVPQHACALLRMRTVSLASRAPRFPARFRPRPTTRDALWAVAGSVGTRPA